MTCDGVVHGYIDTPGVVYINQYNTAEGRLYAFLRQMCVSYDTYPGYAGVWPLYLCKSGDQYLDLTTSEVGQLLGGN